MTPTLTPTKTPWIETASGVRRRTIAVGERLFQMLVEFEVGSSTVPHSHPHEQVIHVIRGKLRLLMSDETVDISAGESYCIASGRPHGAEAQVATLVLDSFSPPREDLVKHDEKSLGK